jgi:competence protein ComEC
MRAPAVLLAVPFVAGSAASILLIDALDPTVARSAAAAALLVLVAGIAAAAQDDRAEATVIVSVGAFLAGLSLGASAAVRAYDPPLLHWFDRDPPREPVLIEGILREDAAVTQFGVSLVVDVLAVGTGADRIPGLEAKPGASLGGVRLSLGGELREAAVGRWRAGRRIRTPAFLRRPSVYFDPGVADERRPLARRGTVLVGSVKSAALVEVVARGSPVSESAAAIRAWTREQIARHVGSRDAKSGGVTTAVLIGDRSGLSADDERRLQEAGTYHVIAISGGNIAILALLIVSAGRLLMIPQRPVAVATCVLLIFYGVIAGGAASVARAVTVAVLVLTARVMDHRGPPLNALAVAAILAVATAPVVVLDAGFILSFGATLGILAGVPLIVGKAARPRGHGLRRAWQRGLFTLKTMAAATVCAEAALAPVAATFFSRVSFAGLVLNFAAIPLMTFVQIGGIVVTATAAWGDAAARLAGFSAHLAANGLLRSAHLVDLAPWLSQDVPPPTLWLVMAYYASLLALLIARVRRQAAYSFAICALVILIGPQPASRDAVAPPLLPLRVVVLDVGQGDATVVALPDGRALLVDAGGLAPFSTTVDAFEAMPGFDVGDRVVAPALRALGVRRIHGLVLTHGDPDHILGVKGVLHHVRTAGIWEGVPVPPHAGLRALATLALERAIPWRKVQAGDVERFGAIEVRVLHPPLPEWERQRVRNEDSVVLEVRIGQVSIVLPGDIGHEGEHAIGPRLDSGRLVVLKAPHHGSATSSTEELIRALRPAAVIFSCGRDNRFGHPHPAVVARYRSIGAEMFSTAEDGAVFVESDGAKVEIWGWLGKRASFAVVR